MSLFPYSVSNYKEALIMNLLVAKAVSLVDAFGGATTLLKCRKIIPPVLQTYRTVRTTNATNWSAAFRTYVRKTALTNVSRMYCFVNRISVVEPIVKMSQHRHTRNYFPHRIVKNKWLNSKSLTVIKALLFKKKRKRKLF